MEPLNQVLESRKHKNSTEFKMPKIMLSYAALKKAEYLEIKTLRDAATKEVFVEIRLINKEAKTGEP